MTSKPNMSFPKKNLKKISKDTKSVANEQIKKNNFKLLYSFQLNS